MPGWRTRCRGRRARPAGQALTFMNRSGVPVARLLSAHRGTSARPRRHPGRRGPRPRHAPDPRAGQPRRPQRPALDHRRPGDRGVPAGPRRASARASCPATSRTTCSPTSPRSRCSSSRRWWAGRGGRGVPGRGGRGRGHEPLQRAEAGTSGALRETRTDHRLGLDELRSTRSAELATDPRFVGQRREAAYNSCFALPLGARPEPLLPVGPLGPERGEPGPREGAPDPEGGSTSVSDRVYEILFIADPNLGGAGGRRPDRTSPGLRREGRRQHLQKVEKWGKKRLAYLVGRHREGCYVLLVAEGRARW